MGTELFHPITKMKNNNPIKYLGMILLIGILTVSFCASVNAVVISSDYSTENPVTIAPGETKIVDMIRLKTSEVDPNQGVMTLQASITEGAGIASLTENVNYSVAPGNPRGIGVNVTLTIPPGTNEGTKYAISFTVRDASPPESQGGGAIGFVQSSSRSVPVLVKTPERTTPPANTNIPTEGKQSNLWWIVLTIVLIYVLMRLGILNGIIDMVKGWFGK